MKKLSCVFALLILLLGSHSCSALSAEFTETHACISRGNASLCEVNHGDMLTEDALVNYHKPGLYKLIKDANPKITNANRIFAKTWIVIPEMPTKAMPSVPAPTSAMTLSKPMAKHFEIATISPALTEAIPSVALAQATMPAEKIAAPIETTLAPAPEVVASEETIPAVPMMLLTLDNRTLRPIAGYRLAIPIDVATAMGIPLEAHLLTHYYLYNPETGKPCGYVRLKKASFARREGNMIAIYVPIKEIPDKPWSLVINPIHEPIPGTMFLANAEEFRGKLPGPPHGIRNMFTAFSLGGSGYVLATAFGPVVGPSAVVGIIATRAILHKIANNTLANADREYDQALQKTGNSPLTMEAGQ